jgi:hypothetical protein
MPKPLRRVLLVSLGVCCALLLPSAVGWAEPVGPPALQVPGAQLGGNLPLEGSGTDSCAWGVAG